MAKTTCSIKGCGQPVKARGWCNKHWRRWREHGDPEAFVAVRRPPECIIEGCGKQVQGHGYCYIHYHSWRKYGDPLATAPRRPNPGGTCQAEEPCDKPVHGRGLCKNHYYRWKTHGTTAPLPEVTLEDRFWPKVENGPIPEYAPHLGPCWIWASADPGEYGFIWVDGRNVGAHRVAYELMVAPIPEGLVLDHLCRNPPCCNPWHLDPVTDAVNNLRGISPFARNASKTHCPAGHPYDDENTYIDRDGGRQCKTCSRERQREAYKLKSKGFGLPGERTHCPQGHPYDEENTYIDPRGHRHCRTCKLERQRARRAA